MIVSHLDSSDRDKLAQMGPSLKRTMAMTNDSFWADVYHLRYGRSDIPTNNKLKPFRLLTLRDIADDFLLYSPLRSQTIHGGCESQQSRPHVTHSYSPSSSSGSVTTAHVASSSDMLRVCTGRKIVCGKFDLRGRVHTTYLSADAEVTSICLSSDGTTCGGLSNGVVMVWEQGRLENNDARRVKGHTGRVTAVEYVPDGVLMSAATDRTIRVRRKERRGKGGSGLGGRVLRGHERGVHWLRYQGDGKLASHGGLDGRVKLWDIETGVCLSTGRLPSSITSVESLKGIVYAAAGDSVHVLDSREGFAQTVGILSLPQKLEGAHYPIGSLKVREDGTLLATAGASAIAVWDARGPWRARGMVFTGRQESHSHLLRAVHSEGRSILACGGTGEVLVASLDGTFRGAIRVDRSSTPIVALGRASRTVWVVRDSGVIQILDLHQSRVHWSDVIDYIDQRHHRGRYFGFWRHASAPGEVSLDEVNSIGQSYDDD